MEPDTEYTFKLKGSEVQVVKGVLENMSFASVGELMIKLQTQLSAQIVK